MNLVWASLEESSRVKSPLPKMSHYQVLDNYTQGLPAQVPVNLFCPGEEEEEVDFKPFNCCTPSGALVSCASMDMPQGVLCHKISQVA